MAKRPTKNLHTNLTLTSESGDSAQLRDLPVSVMQALYHEVTGKTETIKQEYNWDVMITDDDIVRLCDMLLQVIEQYNYRAGDLSISIKHYSGEKITCSSMEKFKQYDRSKPEPTDNVVISLSFLIAHPNYEKYQNYRIDIDLKSFVFLKSGRNLRWGVGYNNLSTFQIQYIDYVIAKNFVSTFDEWSKGLNVNNVSKIPRWFSDWDEFVPPIAAAIAFSSTAFLLNEVAALLGWWGSDLNNIAFRYMITIVSLSAVMGAVGLSLGRLAPYKIWSHGDYPVLIINAGDKRNLEAFKREQSRQAGKWKKIIGGFIVAVALNVIAGLAVNWIS